MPDLLKDLGISDLSFLPEVPIVSLPKFDLGLEDALEGVLAWNPLQAEERLATLTPAWNSILRGLPQGSPEPGLPQPSWQRALEFLKDFRDPKPLEQQTALVSPLVVGGVLSLLIHLGLGWLGWRFWEKSPPSSLGPALPPEVEHRRLVLLEESEEVLKDFKEHPEKKAIPFPFPNMHNFLIKIGTLRPPVSNEKLSSWYRDWNRSLASYEKILQPIEDPIQKLYALGTLLHLDYYHHYARDYPQIVNFLDEELAKGNCDAQTQLFFAAVQRLGIQLPEGYGLGAQLFEKEKPKHILPVLYHVSKDGKIDRVLDMVSGEEKDKVVAPILHPVAFYEWFYRGQTGKSVLSREELVIENPLPENEEKFNGHAPEDGIIPPPVYRGMKVDKALFSKLKREAEQDKERVKLSLFSGQDWGQSYLLTDWNSRVWKYGDGSESYGIDFRSAVHLKAYLQTPPEARERSLLTLLKSNFKAAEASPAFKNLQALLNDPEPTILRLTREEIEDMNKLYSEWIQALRQIGNISKIFSKERNVKEQNSSLTDRFFHTLPLWKNLPDQVESVIERYGQDPQNLLVVLNQMKDYRGRFYFLSFFNRLSFSKKVYEEGGPGYYTFERLPLSPWAALHQLMMDPAQVGWTAQKNQQTPYLPPIPFDDVQLPEGALEEPAKSASGADAPVQAQVVISPAIAIELILFYSRYAQPSGSLLSRWDDQLREEFVNRWEDDYWTKEFMLCASTFILSKLDPEVAKYSFLEQLDSKVAHTPQIRASLQNPVQNKLPPAVQRTLQDIRQKVGVQAYQKLIENPFGVTRIPFE